MTTGTLAKPFQCKYCGEYHRTRQGLSGHIRFKHSNKQKLVQLDAWAIKSMVEDVRLFGEATGLSELQITARQKILRDWLETQNLCRFLKINLNGQDFKNYLVVSLAQLHGRENML